jgi:hypothetical protein
MLSEVRPDLRGSSCIIVHGLHAIADRGFIQEVGADESGLDNGNLDAEP